MKSALVESIQLFGSYAQRHVIPPGNYFSILQVK
jgi:hypothetical protein